MPIAMCALLESSIVPVFFYPTFSSSTISTSFLNLLQLSPHNPHILLVTTFHPQATLSYLLQFLIQSLSMSVVNLGIDWFAQLHRYLISMNKSLIFNANLMFLNLP